MRSVFYNLVINKPFDFEDTYNIDFDSYVYNILKDNIDCSFISLILHDLDLNDNNVLKTIHLHCVIVFNHYVTKNKILDLVSDCLHFPKEVISVVVGINLNSSIRYLIHKDNPDKFQYFEGNILTNNVERVTSIIENPNYDFLDYTTLYKICMSANSLTEVMSIIGLQNYKKYRLCIKDIFEVKRGW